MADSAAMRVGVRNLLVRLAWALAIAAAVVVAWLAALLTLGISRTPTVPASASVATQDIERALQLLKRHDPRWQRSGIVRAVVAEERDLNLLLEHAAARLPWLRGRVGLSAGAADLKLSIDLARWWRRAPGSGRGPWWLNLEVRMGPASGLPELLRMSAGPVPIPTPVAEWAGRALLQRYAPGLDLKVLHDVIRRVDIRRGRLLAFYAWQDDTSARLLNALTPPAEQQRLQAYAERLAHWTAGRQPAWVVSLPALLQPLFELAQQRVASGADAVAENRAALMTATLYANRRNIAAVVPAARGWPRPRWMTVTLAGRTDTPLHYLISAALAAESGAPLADAVGLYKELADSRNGSGFSFNDLAADRAGTRLGELATREPARLQAVLAAGVAESALLPDITDLPESLSQAQLEQRYGGVGAQGYARMVADIDARLDTAALLR